MNLFIRWCLLVTLSAIAGFIGGLLNDEPSLQYIAGMLLGILTFIFIYYGLDKFLIKIQRDDLRKSLKLSIYIKMVLQLIPVIDGMAGAFAINIVEDTVGSEPEILFTYLATLLVGFILSWFVAVTFLIIRLFAKARQTETTAKP